MVKITEEEVWGIITKNLENPIIITRNEILERDKTYPETFIYQRIVQKLKEVLGVK